MVVPTIEQKGVDEGFKFRGRILLRLCSIATH